jgi:putative membrane protein
MIPSYSDHAANERTFLAWVRTGIAVIAFGFVVQKFNLFLRTLVASSMVSVAERTDIARQIGSYSRYEGPLLILVGLALIIIAAARFVHTSRRIDDKELHKSYGVRAEVILSAVLAVIVAGFSAVIVLS